ncbi:MULTISPECIES: hypothetical protein [unclassified Novosphingobium]|uniref:hypothetical protein n=1 Tax=unclassified Novosphingobium TaxID=2644732 RepID=UPI000D4C13DE|nr:MULTISPECIES: hypothetical protein [unclassified Novosphingobium]PTR07909.1 hypothetical protein C8K11_113120 [Novosphingobium sp. GV055]PUB00722.1 hypothetical protein C8K12_113120 [Novosphingobium sp. GV061]PUB16131.1 hypothetical protein C8K14_113120 [Novosphingobium sp. GV079]PUB39596.1 hypothetical protein C8K10_113120 [Novosphingobium sp. GV027]
MDIETQREIFTEAVEALGGPRTVAQQLGVTERTIFRLTSGQSRIHEGWLEDISKALIAHADHCRKLEQRLHPAFAANRTEAQATPPRHDGNASRRKPKADPQRVAQAARALGLTSED